MVSISRAGTEADRRGAVEYQPHVRGALFSSRSLLGRAVRENIARDYITDMIG